MAGPIGPANVFVWVGFTMIQGTGELGTRLGNGNGNDNGLGLGLGLENRIGWAAAATAPRP